MADKDLQDMLNVISSAGNNGVEPQELIETLINRDYDMQSVIEAVQLAIEHGKISLSSDGMVVALDAQYAHAA